jgi:2-oxoisovalerate dehydrogenase E2 component (dihydrolipoyl transacylase)
LRCGDTDIDCSTDIRFVEPGSLVEEFDVLVEVQSDKASVEITSRYAGKVAEHCYKVGEVAKVGSALCKIEVQKKEGEDDEGESSTKPGSEDATLHDRSEGSSSKNSKEATVPEEKEGKPTREMLSFSQPENDAKSTTLATPAVRRIVRENGVNIDRVNGTGKSGRVTKEDVQDYLASQASSSSKQPASAPPTIDRDSQEDKVVTLSGTKKAMYKALSETWKIPHFGYSDEIDVSSLNQIRKELQQSRDSNSTDPKLTLLPFLLKALSLAMYNHPIFRSTFDSSSMTLRERQAHRISIALSTPRGLLTPTLESDIRSTSIMDIAQQIQALQRITSERNLTQKEMGAGATVTLSNIGSVGGLFTAPLIPPTGQTIIGAIGKSRILPRFDANGDLVKAMVLPVSFSADHRIVEGVELARFVQEWKELLENPTSWLLRLR